jgi:hypothetical protein
MVGGRGEGENLVDVLLIQQNDVASQLLPRHEYYQSRHLCNYSLHFPELVLTGHHDFCYEPTW